MSELGMGSHVGQVPWEPKSLRGREWGHTRALGLKAESRRGRRRSLSRVLGGGLGHSGASFVIIRGRGHVRVPELEGRVHIWVGGASRTWNCT